MLSEKGELSCEAYVKAVRTNALIDTGAAVSLIRSEIVRKMKNRPALLEADLVISQVDGSQMKIEGKIRCPIKVGGVQASHTLYVAPELCTELIVGEDWLKARKACLEFEPAKLILGEIEVPLGKQEKDKLIVVAKEDIQIPPRKVVSCERRMLNMEVEGEIHRVAPVKKYEDSEEGITLCESVVQVKEIIPVLIANTSNKTVKVQKGEEMGHAFPLRRVDQVRLDQRVKENPGKLREEEIMVPDKYRRDIRKLLRDNKDRIANEDKELGQTQTVSMKIDTGNHPPIRLRPYRTPVHKRGVVEEAVRDMLEAGIIERSKSPWSFPIVIVEKKNGGHRFCVDIRKLNAITKPMAVPLPLIDDILALLGGSACFSTLDLSSGYWQVALDKMDREKAAFTCHVGLFNFRVMPFGLSNAPGVFSQLMSMVLEGLEGFAMAYLDDVLVFSKTPEEHLAHLQQVMDRLREHNLKIKLPKCQFMKEETKYLGFIIDKKGIKPDLDKVEVIRAMPEPRSVREVRGFIGAIGYYRRFIPAFSRLAGPMIALTKKYARFKWTEDCQRALDCLKEQLTAIPLLAYPDLGRLMISYTDASDKCVGAVLT